MKIAVERSTLDNGAVLLVSQRKESPCVIVTGSIPAGSFLEDDEHAGLADFVARLLMRGTAERTHQQIAQGLEDVGASIGFGASAETISFTGKSLPEHLDLLSKNISDCLRNAAFPADEVEKVRGMMVTGIKQRLDDTRSRAADLLRELAYPVGHPYRRDGVATLESLETIGREQIAAFRERNFSPRGMIIAVCGNVEPARARESVEAAFCGWEAREHGSAQIDGGPSLAEAVRRVVPMPHKSQADIAVGFPGARRSDPGFYALTQANLILGRLGLMGRLGEHVRDEMGLAYYCHSMLEQRRGVGLWLLRAGVNPANVERAIEAMQGEVARMAAEKVGEDEIADAQGMLVGSMALQLDQTGGVVYIVHYIEYHGLGLDYLERYPGIVRSVTREQILESAARRLDRQRCATVIAGPVKD